MRWDSVRPLTAVVVACACLLLTIGACAHTRPEPSAQPTPVSAERHDGERVGPSAPAHLRIDVYRLRGRPNETMRFSLDPLEDKAADPKALLDALGAYGQAELAYRFDQDVDLGIKTEMAVGRTVPIVDRVATSAEGRPVPTFRDWNDGCTVSVSGEWSAEGSEEAAALLLGIKLSGMHTSIVTVAPGIYLPTITERSCERSVCAVAGRPVLFAAHGHPGASEHEVDGAIGCVVCLRVDRQARPG